MTFRRTADLPTISRSAQNLEIPQNITHIRTAAMNYWATKDNTPLQPQGGHTLNIHYHISIDLFIHHHSVSTVWVLLYLQDIRIINLLIHVNPPEVLFSHLGVSTTTPSVITKVQHEQFFSWKCTVLKRPPWSECYFWKDGLFRIELSMGSGLYWLQFAWVVQVPEETVLQPSAAKK